MVPYRIEISAQLLSHLVALADLRTRRLQDIGDITQPSGALLEILVSLGKGRQSRLEALVELRQTGIIALGQQVEAEVGHLVEPFISLHPSQAKRRSTFEGQEITRAAKQLCDHVVGLALWRPV